MVRLYKDPKGDTIFTHVTNDATGAAGTGFATADGHDRVTTLEKKVKELQAQLTAVEVVIIIVPNTRPSWFMLLQMFADRLDSIGE